METLDWIVSPILQWYGEYKRDLPWRRRASAYAVWLSEIMLQQTRVEAVKPYYARFLQELPTIKDLAEAPEQKLLKLWEGLGYYNRVRNMQQAAREICQQYQGRFPDQYDQIRGLKGIGDYTAGAISSIAFHLPYPAVDGNVLRVVARICGDDSDIAKASVKKKMEQQLQLIIPLENPGDFNQGLIELGALVCVPNGQAKCEQCPLRKGCVAREKNLVQCLPVKSKAKSRRQEKRTVLLLSSPKGYGITIRPSKGLLAGMSELPNVEGHLSEGEALAYVSGLGLHPIGLRPLPPAKHIFSHVEWQMTAYLVELDPIKPQGTEKIRFLTAQEIREESPIPSAFDAYKVYIM